jgi:hypothetical protein
MIFIRHKQKHKTSIPTSKENFMNCMCIQNVCSLLNIYKTISGDSCLSRECTLIEGTSVCFFKQNGRSQRVKKSTTGYSCRWKERKTKKEVDTEDEEDWS